MKKIFLLLIFALISTQGSYALNSSPSEMKHKKEKALKWSDSNFQSNNKESSKEKSFLKTRALRWHSKKAVAYTKEIDHSKKKALRWYERNSK